MLKTDSRDDLKWLKAAALLYLFVSTPALIAAHMPALAYLFIAVPWSWGRVALIASGLVFIFLWKKPGTLKLLGLIYFAAPFLYLTALAYLLTSMGVAVVIACVVCGALVGILSVRRFWIALPLAALALIASSVDASPSIALIAVGTLAFFIPRRLLGHLSPVALALLVVSMGLHIQALKFFKYRISPTAAEGVDRIQMKLDGLPPTARIRFAERIEGDRWLLGLRMSVPTWLEIDASSQKAVATANGSGESSDAAAIDGESGVVYVGDYNSGCIKALSLDGLKPLRSRCLKALRPTFLGLDRANGLLYVASDFSERFTALDADTLEVVAGFSCKGGIHHFCSFPDGRIAAVSGLGTVYLFEPRLENPRVVADVLGFFIFHVACDPERDAVYV
ncbi:MAG TPA: hypothetical protein ENF73_06075, partial [Proteobacteria bacterium]|nr:hypothetical protein [Pseudomonadota bacterium]